MVFRLTGDDTQIYLTKDTMHDVDGKTVIVAEITPGLQRPYHIKSLGQEQGTFVRVAGTTRQAD